jgi:hypothetical protein
MLARKITVEIHSKAKAAASDYLSRVSDVTSTQTSSRMKFMLLD